MPANNEQEEIIFSLLENILNSPRQRIQLDDRLIQDLRMDSDDFSFLFAPNLEIAIGAKITQQEWDEIITVRDVINLAKTKIGRT